MKKYLAAILLLFLLVPSASWAVYSLPAERSVDWTYAGVPGGIPNRTVGKNAITDYGADNTGTSDSRTAIQNCLDGTADNTACYLPAGTYRLDSSISIPAYRVLRGAGMDQTTLIFYMASGTRAISGGGTNKGAAVSVTSGYDRGSTTLTLSSVSGISSGTLIVLDADSSTETEAWVSNDAGIGTCTWCSVGTDADPRVVGEIHRVTGVSGDNVTLEVPIRFPYIAAQTPEIHVLQSVSRYMGLEDLKVTRGNAYVIKYGLQWTQAANSWIKGVKFENLAQQYTTETYYGYRNTYQGNWFNGSADNCNQPDRGYGIRAGYFPSNYLIVNNIFNDLHDPIVIESGGGAANVIAYNYATRPRYDDQACDVLFDEPANSRYGWTPGIFITHGSHTSYTLFEGNDTPALMADSYWGTSSHTVAFRNKVHGAGKDPRIPDYPTAWNTYNNVAMRVESGSEMFSAIGNILGTDNVSTLYEISSDTYPSGYNNCIYQKTIYTIGYAGQSTYNCGTTGYNATVLSTFLRHANYDYISDNVIYSGADDQALPDSLYLSEKPSWWCNESTWPPVNPAGPTYSDIPAKIAYDGGACTLGTDTIPTQYFFINQTGVALGSTNNSDNQVVLGIDNQTTLALTGDASCKYSINGAAWATADDNVSLNDNVALQNVASGAYSDPICCTANIGGVTDEWCVTTLAASAAAVPQRFRGGNMGSRR